MQSDVENELPDVELNVEASAAYSALADTQPIPIVLPNPPPPPEVPKLTVTDLARGTAVSVSMKSPSKITGNEDSVAAIRVFDNQGLLVVADGLGGHRGGRKASQLMIKGLRRSVEKLPRPGDRAKIVIGGAIEIPISRANDRSGDKGLRSLILDQIDATNRRLIRKRAGSATTVALVEINENRIRPYHAGDSSILVVSQRGKLKLETVSHSPVGYALHSGVITEEQALYHAERHLVSNVVGTRELSVELGPWVSLSQRDTVLLASDGLFDNLYAGEVVNLIRKGPLEAGVRKLAELALRRMCQPDSQFPSKPDDLTILAYRRTS